MGVIQKSGMLPEVLFLSCEVVRDKVSERIFWITSLVEKMQRGGCQIK